MLSVGLLHGQPLAGPGEVEQPGLDTLPANATCIARARPVLPSTVSFLPVFPRWVGSGGTLTIMAQHPVSDEEWIIGEREGQIFRFHSEGGTFVSRGVFADLRDRVVTSWYGSNAMELGLLAAIYHPDFANNGEVFVYYTAAGTLPCCPVTARLSRFRSLDGGVTLDANSEQVLFSIEHSTEIHKGAALAFGPDGYLYIGLGDGDVRPSAQDLSDLRGKMLRIDVTGGRPYAIPPDNPFVHHPAARPEIYALGFRNPWRWSFDRDTGELWLGDVGQVAWEEVNVVRKGANYGWPIREGAHCFQAATCDRSGLTDPLYEYPHAGTAAIVGGRFYRDSAIPALHGTYLFGDAPTGQLFAIEYDESGNPASRLIGQVPSPSFVFSLEEARAGELYVLGANRVYRMMPATGGAADPIPPTLSQSGCVDPLNPTAPAPGLIPYGVNVALWSDGADKERWLALPPGGRITVKHDGDWDFPIGTVLVKHFRLRGKLVETRLFMRHDDGDWGGYSYEWNDEQSDAELLTGAKRKSVAGQEWLFPSRSQCTQCHTSAAGGTLGLETVQLNGLLHYPQTDRIANQITTLRHLGLFDDALPDASTLPAFPAIDDASSEIDSRARAYLHANCAMCHRPGGPGRGSQDFRHFIPGEQTNIYDAPPTQGDFGIEGARLYAPGDPEHSMISLRMHTLQPGRMPPLSSSRVDPTGTAVIDQWIRSGLGFGVPDGDGDAHADNLDNCPYLANADQRDTDADGFGNRCDADLNDDGMVNSLDLGLFKTRFGSIDPDADFNADGIVNALDLGILKQLFGKQPGGL